MALGIHLFARPHAGRAFAAAQNHSGRLARKKVPLVRITVKLGIAPRHPVLDPPPLFATIIAAEKTARGRNIIALLTTGVILHVVHIDVVDTGASVFPRLAVVLAQQHTTVFEQYKK